jgi:hypothetical protein
MQCLALGVAVKLGAPPPGPQSSRARILAASSS